MNNNIDMSSDSDECTEDSDLGDDEIFHDCEEPVNDDSNYCIDDNINSEDLRTLHPHTSCTVLDLYCMIYAFSTRHSLTWVATEDLLHLINQVIGREEISPSKYILKKKMKQISSWNVLKHFTCPQCDLYLGCKENIERLNEQCPNCQSKIKMDTKYRKNYFITIPFHNHLQNVLERNSDRLIFGSKPLTTNIHDVHDSLYFQNLKNEMKNDPMITITFSVDGAQVHESAKDNSLWPLQFVINEIDLEHRFKRENMFCAGISYGKSPNMHVFFKKFIEDINLINAEGGLTFKMKNGEMKTVQIFPMIFTADTPAKCDVLNKVYFNGYKGCPYCTHDGTLVNKQIRYCQRDNGPLRTNEQTRLDMLQANSTKKRTNGYHGLSVLFALKWFDLVWQVGIDKMHCVDLGVVRLLFRLFFDHENRKERYF